MNCCSVCHVGEDKCEEWCGRFMTYVSSCPKSDFEDDDYPLANENEI
jgi:hypothetical protein